MIGRKACRIPRFKRGGLVTIQQWLYQMKYHFEANAVPPSQWVKNFIINFHTDHFTELQEHRHLPYFDFKEIVIELFKSPDLTHTRLKELIQIKQNSDEAPE